MGTKQNPGAIDCYAAAKPDEPMFVLLARDSKSPGLVAAWAEQYRADKESYNSNGRMTVEQYAKYCEALDVANEMTNYRKRMAVKELE